MYSRSSIALYPATSGRKVNRLRRAKADSLPDMGTKEKEASLGETVWLRVSDLMKADHRYDHEENITRLGELAKIGGTASRIKAKKTSFGLDVLIKVATHFHIQPYELIISDRDLLRLVRVYHETTKEGRVVLMTAASIAEQTKQKAEDELESTRMGKAGKAHDR